MVKLITDAPFSSEIKHESIPACVLKKTGRYTIQCTAELAFSFLTGILSKDLPPANRVYPKELMSFIHQIVVKPTTDLREFLKEHLPTIEKKFEGMPNPKLDRTVNYTDLLATAISEELIVRGLIQTVLLKECPHFILKQISPENAALVDDKVAKVARSLFTAAIFALGHGKIDGDHSSLLPQFVSGLLFSYWREQGVSLGDLAVAHTLLDILACQILKGMPR